MPVLTAAGPVLVHFDYAQLNSVRTLPYLGEWSRRYREAGLSVIGVQSPRFPFGSDPVNVRPACATSASSSRSRCDAERALTAYGCGAGQPFPLDDGRRPQLVPLGEGRVPSAPEGGDPVRQLRELDALQALPAPMEPLRPSDAPGTR